MRHVLTSFLALHWAVVFALLAYICMDGNRGIASALGVLGVSLQSSRFPDLDHALVVAPLAVALLIVALLFCWAFVETLLNIATRPDAGDTVVRIAFICASFLLSVILVGGAAQGINGLFMVVAIQMTERRSASTAMTLHEGEAPLVSRRMAAGVAHSSLLSRISSRPETRPGGRR
ncbi:MAG: hypothetical protein E5X11_10885 [Mesorhizobium sp.]|nr:MAG: hypothetical protein E5X11_10885 [Mesorhizobium sp.]